MAQPVRCFSFNDEDKILSHTKLEELMQAAIAHAQWEKLKDWPEKLRNMVLKSSNGTSNPIDTSVTKVSKKPPPPPWVKKIVTLLKAPERWVMNVKEFESVPHFEAGFHFRKRVPKCFLRNGLQELAKEWIKTMAKLFLQPLYSNLKTTQDVEKFFAFIMGRIVPLYGEVEVKKIKKNYKKDIEPLSNEIARLQEALHHLTKSDRSLTSAEEEQVWTIWGELDSAIQEFDQLWKDKVVPEMEPALRLDEEAMKKKSEEKAKTLQREQVDEALQLERLEALAQLTASIYEEKLKLREEAKAALAGAKESEKIAKRESKKAAKATAKNAKKIAQPVALVGDQNDSSAAEATLAAATKAKETLQAYSNTVAEAVNESQKKSCS
jgi:hypothetical protein